MLIKAYDHIQLAIPVGGEEAARVFYGGLLQMSEQPKPPILAARGGCWFSSGSVALHLGVEESFLPAKKAHPAFVVEDLDALAYLLGAAGYVCQYADETADRSRFHTHDPFGNRLEFVLGSVA